MKALKKSYTQPKARVLHVLPLSLCATSNNNVGGYAIDNFHANNSLIIPIREQTDDNFLDIN